MELHAPDKIKIQVNNHEFGTINYWAVDKFSDRYYAFKDLVDHFLETNQIFKLSQDEDPFYDPPMQIEVGICYIILKPLVYLFDIMKNLLSRKTATLRVQANRIF